MTPRIDAHQHFWRLESGDYGWITPDLTPIARNFGPDDLAPLLARTEIAATILVQAAPTDRDSDAMLAVADATPWVAGVVGWVDMVGEAAPARIETLARHPRFRGIRPMLQDDPDIGWLTSRNAARALDALQAHDLRFDALIRAHQIGAIAALADRRPELPIVINHAAKPPLAAGDLSGWKQAMRDAARRPNIACKLSGLLTDAAPGADAETLAPVLDLLLGAFGPERLIWGSDWPVLLLASDYVRWHDLTLRLLAGHTDAAGLAAIMGGNAARFYGLAV